MCWGKVQHWPIPRTNSGSLKAWMSTTLWPWAVRLPRNDAGSMVIKIFATLPLLRATIWEQSYCTGRYDQFGSQLHCFQNWRTYQWRNPASGYHGSYLWYFQRATETLSDYHPIVSITSIAICLVLISHNSAPSLVSPIIGFWLMAFLNRRFGRRVTIKVSGACILVGSLASIANSWKFLLTSRLLRGIGMGVLAYISSIYGAEVSTARSRGRAISWWQL